jgi:hypothetical protein
MVSLRWANSSLLQRVKRTTGPFPAFLKAVGWGSSAKRSRERRLNPPSRIAPLRARGRRQDQGAGGGLVTHMHDCVREAEGAMVSTLAVAKQAPRRPVTHALGGLFLPGRAVRLAPQRRHGRFAIHIRGVVLYLLMRAPLCCSQAPGAYARAARKRIDLPISGGQMLDGFVLLLGRYDAVNRGLPF